MKTHKIVVSIASLCLIFLLGCPSPSDSGGGTTPVNPDKPLVDTKPAAPVNLRAEFNDKNNVIDITWDNSSENVTYEVFRVKDSSEQLLTNQDYADSNYSDKSFPLETTIFYKVRSYKTVNNLYSDFKESTTLVVNISDLTVKNIKATVLEFDDKNRITWDIINNPNLTPEYEVYRYISKNDQNPVKVNSTIFNGIDNSKYIDDINALTKTPYYYCLKWKDTTSNQVGMDSDYVFGIYVDTGDEKSSEPNDDYINLPYANTFPDMNDLFIFKHEEITDVDCFKINVAPADPNPIKVTVAVNGSYQGDLKYEYIYNNVVVSSDLIFSGLPNYFNKFDFGDDTNSTEKKDIYFRIIPTADSTYTYQISK